MKVILTKDVEKIGKTGEMKTVADGFATNYLIPQKLAVPASGGAYRIRCRRASSCNLPGSALHSVRSRKESPCIA